MMKSDEKGSPVTLFKQHEFVKPNNNKFNYIFDRAFEDCRGKHFHSFKHRCIFDVQFTAIKKK